MLIASITDSLVTFATHVIRDLGLGGVFLLVAADALGVPIAAAAIMLCAGFNVSEGHLSLFGIIAAGTLGEVAGSAIAYWIGATGGHELLERHGGKLHVTAARLDVIHRWFERHGALVIAVGRNVPVVRTYISYPAGVARMGFGRFLAATAIGGGFLVIVWGLIGRSVGHSWTQWKHALGYVDYAVGALIVIAAAWLVVRWYRSRGSGRPADAAA
jgi:membrane protein DedA with SNARE-associated domain